MSERTAPRVDRMDAVFIALVSSLAFVVGMRTMPFVLGSGGVTFMGNDAWYHWRSIEWSSANWPNALGYDPFTGWPAGRDAGQFGTLFDVVIATLVSGAGSVEPSPAVAAAATPVLAAALAATMYLFVARSFDRPAALAAALVVAVAPGALGRVTAYGYLDHHAAESLLLLLFVFALSWSYSRGPASWLLPGAIFAAYSLVWPPAMFAVPVAWCATMLHCGRTYLRGDETGWGAPMLAFCGAMMTALALLLPFASIGTSSATTLGDLQISIVLISGAGMALALFVFLAARGRRRLGSAALAALISISVVAVFLSERGARMIGYARQHVLFGSTSPIVEADGPGLTTDGAALLGSELALGLPIAVAGMLLLFDAERADHWFMAAFLVVAVMMTLTQSRYGYYMVVPAAFWIGAASSASSTWMSGAASPGWANVAVAAAVALVIVSPASALALAQDAGPAGGEPWAEATEWLGSEPDDHGLDPLGEYSAGGDGCFDAPDGSYGVLAWWDYGHWITTRAGIPAVANPMQQHASVAADYLTASSEDDADDALGGTGCGGEVRYVVTTNATAGEKLEHVLHWASDDAGDDDGGMMIHALQGGDGDGLERHRLVFSSSDGGSVKVFERVEGAVIEGTAGPGSEIAATVDLIGPDGSVVGYSSATTAGPDGSFFLRVAHPTVEPGASQFGADGPYEILVDGEPAGTAHVPLDAVVDGGPVGVSHAD